MNSLNHGYKHWLYQRLTAVWMLLMMLGGIILGGIMGVEFTGVKDVVFFTISIITIVFIVWHSKLGLESIFLDYIQSSNTKYFAMAIINIISIKVIFDSIIYLIYYV